MSVLINMLSIFLVQSQPTIARVPYSLHSLELRLHAGSPPFSLEVNEPETPAPVVNRTVYGYLPYWTSSGYRMRWDLLTTLAWFSLEMSSNGSITKTHGWGNQASCDLVTNAHDAGVRLEVVVTLFSSSGIHTLLSSSSNRQHAVAELVQQVGLCGADGVNIDFEGLDSGDKNAMVTFVSELKAALVQVDSGATVTLATPAVDWSDAWDYDRLAQESDGLMIMGYDYHWKGGNPGPVAPLDAGSWGGKSLSWTIDDYFQYGGRENRDKFIIGLPWYGYDWPSVDDTVPGGKARGSGKAVIYLNAVPNASIHGRKWDDGTKTPYYTYNQAGDGWHQAFYDDSQSLYYKYALANTRDLGGIGIWALGYEGEGDELWDPIRTLFGNAGDQESETGEEEMSGEEGMTREENLEIHPEGEYGEFTGSEAETTADAESEEKGACDADDMGPDIIDGGFREKEEPADAASAERNTEQSQDMENDGQTCRCKPCNSGCGCSGNQAGSMMSPSLQLFLLLLLLMRSFRRNSKKAVVR
ncbi:MAG: hypothetical protein GXP49_10775 [Deltaproteobacteria bacterium]|nr:hypothetical protein [Deltaproteobacteria bacterium]